MPKIATVEVVNDKSAEFIEAMKKQVQIGLKAIGAEVEGYAKEECPVDTGRLRNSITWTDKDEQSKPNTSGGEPAKASDYRRHKKPEESTVYIGTNVEYAPYVEYGDYNHTTGKNHFLRDAATNHSEHYKAIMEAALKAIDM